MVDIKEIRQGNYVKYADHKYWNPDIRGQLVKVDSDIYREIDSNPHLYDLVELTPDLLINQCGFQKIEQNTNLFKNINMPYYVQEAVCLFFNEPETNNYSTINAYLGGFGFINLSEYYAATFKWIHYLHELQNLFKELTHKEITINL